MFARGCSELRNWSPLFFEGNMKTQAVVSLVMIACCAIVFSSGCEDGQVAGPGGNAQDDSPSGMIQRIDKHGEEIMAGQSKAEARDWLKVPSHLIFKEDSKQIAQIVEDFYAAGAQQVLIGDIESHDGKDFAGAVLVVLPQDAAGRAKLFEVGNRAAPVFQEDPITDQGQKYLYYTLD
jgi:hypothetical protein